MILLHLYPQYYIIKEQNYSKVWKMQMEEKKFKYDIIADKIMEQIASGVYKSGDKLPSEGELTKIYDVSRVTLRESLKKLSMMGVVSIMQGDGTYVNVLRPAGFMRPLFPLLAYNTENIEEIYTVRILMEGHASELAAHKRSGNDVIVLRQLIDDMDRSVQQRDFNMYSELDMNFHLCIQNAAQNETMLMILSLFNDLVKGYVPNINTSIEIVEDSFKDHQLICEAICNRRRELAGIVMREHLLKAKNTLIINLQRNKDSI